MGAGTSCAPALLLHSMFYASVSALPSIARSGNIQGLGNGGRVTDVWMYASKHGWRHVGLVYDDSNISIKGILQN